MFLICGVVSQHGTPQVSIIWTLVLDWGAQQKALQGPTDSLLKDGGYWKRGHQKDVTTGWPESWTLAIGDSSPTPFLGMCSLLNVLILRPFQGCSLEILCCETIWTVVWLNQLRLLCRQLAVAQINLLHKFPCLFTLPPTIWSGLPILLPSMYMGQFWIPTWKLWVWSQHQEGKVLGDFRGTGRSEVREHHSWMCTSFPFPWKLGCDLSIHLAGSPP